MRIKAHLWIPGKLPGQNEIVAAAKRKQRAGPGSYHWLKKDVEERIHMAIYAAELPGFGPGVTLTYELVEPNEDRDPGNILAGAMKFVEDALVRTMVLTGDGWRGIAGYGKPTWRVSSEDGVSVTIEGVERNAGKSR